MVSSFPFKAGTTVGDSFEWDAGLENGHIYNIDDVDGTNIAFE
ncbi:4008_t:CDS:1, partial [Ambispora gerdemannii]